MDEEKIRAKIRDLAPLLLRYMNMMEREENGKNVTSPLTPDEVEELYFDHPRYHVAATDGHGICGIPADLPFLEINPQRTNCPFCIMVLFLESIFPDKEHIY